MTPMHLNNWPRPLRIVWRHRIKFTLPAIAVALSVWSLAALLPRTYEATSKFQRVSDTVLATTGNKAIDSVLAPMRQTLEEDIKGRAALEAIVDDPSLPYATTFARTSEGELTATGRTQRQQTLTQLTSQITVETTVASQAVDVVVIAVRDRDAALAADLANQLTERYLVEAREHLAEQLIAADDFFTEQIEAQQNRMAQLREEKIQIEHQYPTLRSADASVARDQLIGTRAELRSIEQQLLPLEEERAALTQWTDDQPEHLEQRTRGRNPKVAQLNAQKAQLEQDLSEHRYKWGRTDEHPLVIKTLAQIKALDQTLASTPKIIDLVAQRQTNLVKLETQVRLESIEAIYQKLSSRRDILKNEVEQLETQYQASFAGRDRYDQVVLALTDVRRDLAFWQNRQRDASLARSMGQVDLSVLQYASSPHTPVFPPRGLVSFTAILLGLVSGFATVIMARKMDQSFDSVAAAQEELGLPILGMVAEIVESQQDDSWKTPLKKAA